MNNLHGFHEIRNLYYRIMLRISRFILLLVYGSLFKFLFFIRYTTRIAHNLGIKKGFHIHDDSFLHIVQYSLTRIMCERVDTQRVVGT